MKFWLPWWGYRIFGGIVGFPSPIVAWSIETKAFERRIHEVHPWACKKLVQPQACCTCTSWVLQRHPFGLGFGFRRFRTIVPSWSFGWIRLRCPCRQKWWTRSTWRTSIGQPCWGPYRERSTLVSIVPKIAARGLRLEFRIWRKSCQNERSFALTNLNVNKVSRIFSEFFLVYKTVMKWIKVEHYL